jgi:hypothetical protein
MELVNAKVWLMSQLKPTCYVCQCPVIKFELEQDFRCSSYVFIAQCHGCTEVVSMTNETLAGLIGSKKLHAGIAFHPDRMKLLEEYLVPSQMTEPNFEQERGISVPVDTNPSRE